jgi:hypothetical protein
MLNEALFIIAVYCLVDEIYGELYPVGVRRGGFAPRFSDVEALTIAIVGEYLGDKRDKALYEYFAKHYRSWFPHLPDRSQLVRQWANLWQVEQAIWQALVKRHGADQSVYQIIDTVPIPVCGLRRYKGRHTFPDDDPLLQADVGYCASKHWYYFGFKGGLRIAANGLIVHAPLLAARPHDSQHTATLLAGMPAGAIGLGDAGFLDEDEQRHWQATFGVSLLTPLRRNMQPNSFVLFDELKPLRQLIETVYAQCVERFHVQALRVRKAWTLAAKWYRKVLAHTVLVSLNLQYGRSPLDFAGLVAVD